MKNYLRSNSQKIRIKKKATDKKEELSLQGTLNVLKNMENNLTISILGKTKTWSRK